MTQLTYLNGEFVPHEEAFVHVEDRGFVFADGIYDFFLVHRGCLVNGEAHLDRIEYSLGELEITPPMTRDALRDVLKETAARNGVTEGHLYIQITRGAAPRSHPFPKPPVAPTVVITVRPAPYPTLEQTRAPWTVITAPDLRWKRCDIKSLALLPNILTREMAVRAGADEAWMFDADGFVTEGASSNVWIVTDAGEVITRQLDSAILGGVTRRMLQAVFDEAGATLVQRPFTLNEAKAAREAFMTNTPFLVKPVTRIDETVIADGTPGPVTLKLIDAYRAFVESQCEPKAQRT